VSSQVVHVGPGEKETLSRIPREVAFRAPGLPRGHVLLGLVDHGSCPMMRDGHCVIYPHRPSTCRTYDCRVFPATGLTPDLVEQAGIAHQAGRWRFRVDSDAERVLADAVRAAAAFLTDHRDQFPTGLLPTNPTQLAVVAVEIHPRFAPRVQPAASTSPTGDAHEGDGTEADPADPEPAGPDAGPDLASVAAAVTQARDRARGRAGGR
jgi:hypothetical protein